jgi:hypothetical protein
LLEGESSFAFFCLFFYIPHPLDAPESGKNYLKVRLTLDSKLLGGNVEIVFFLHKCCAKKLPLISLKIWRKYDH